LKYNKNVGIVNAYIRTAFGFTLLSWATAKMVKKPWCQSYLLVAIFAALNISEGIVRYCPIKDIFGIGQDHSQDKDQKDQEESSFQEPIIPYSHL
jgi:hypothetical protein